MDRLTFRGLITALVLLVLLCVPSIASADGVTWTLTNVIFNDSGTASGSFFYDASTNTVNTVDITTSNATYTAVYTDASLPQDVSIVLLPSATNLTGLPYLDLEFVSPLTNSGGIVDLLTGFAGEFTCSDSTCSGTDINGLNRTVSSGAVTGVVPTPEPSALLLLGMGLVTLVGAARRKVFQA